MAASADTDVTAVVVTHGASEYLARCLDSIAGIGVIVVQNDESHGADDIAHSHPAVEVIRQPNRGFGPAVNAGLARAGGRYALVLNDDAWLDVGALEWMVRYADAHPRVAVVGPRLVYPDGRPQGSMRGFPTPWRLATQYFFLSRLAPWTRLFNGFYAGEKDPHRVNEVEFLKGACLLVRMAAVAEVGGLDETFFMFAEEADWCMRFRRAGWTVVYLPNAVVTHVGAATTSSAWVPERTYREQERSHIHFLVKHEGDRVAERGRRIILWGYRLRALLSRGARRTTYRSVARWLAGATIAELARADPVDPAVGGSSQDG